MAAILQSNRYGKSRVRLVKVTRHTDRHDLSELTVHIKLEGAFEESYTEGDNSRVVPTDTMKNVVYVLGKQHPVDPIEGFALRLIEHFLGAHAQVERVLVRIAERRWTRLDGFTFERSSEERRTARISGTRSGVKAESGIEDMVLLKTTKSGFEGYLKDQYTTLKETSDRILASSIAASWRYSSAEVDFNSCRLRIREKLVETFAAHDSKSVQQTLYAMGEAALDAAPEITEIRLAMPNKHCLLVDLKPFGLENANEIFVPVDEPHGSIEATLVRA